MTNYDMMRLSTKMGQRWFFFQGVRVRNSVDNKNKKTTSLQSLKKLLRIYRNTIVSFKPYFSFLCIVCFT